jgi:hypothetical protein
MKRSSHAALALLLPLVLLTGCRKAKPSISSSSAGAELNSGDLVLTGGGVRIVESVPTLFYGTVTTGGKRRFTYLIIGKPLIPSENFSRSGPGRSSVNNDRILTEHTLELDGIRCVAKFEARNNIPGKKIEDPKLTLNSKESEGWIYLFDWTDPHAGARAIEVQQPTLPMDVNDLVEFTAEFVRDLTESNEAVHAFVSVR